MLRRLWHEKYQHISAALAALGQATIEQLAKEEGVNLNQFVATAVAEKLSAINTAAFFLERRDRADFEAFRAILTRQGGKPPRTGDELPPD